MVVPSAEDDRRQRVCFGGVEGGGQRRCRFDFNPIDGLFLLELIGAEAVAENEEDVFKEGRDNWLELVLYGGV